MHGYAMWVSALGYAEKSVGLEWVWPVRDMCVWRVGGLRVFVFCYLSKCVWMCLGMCGCSGWYMGTSVWWNVIVFVGSVNGCVWDCECGRRRVGGLHCVGVRGCMGVCVNLVCQFVRIIFMVVGVGITIGVGVRVGVGVAISERVALGTGLISRCD